MLLADLSPDAEASIVGFVGLGTCRRGHGRRRHRGRRRRGGGRGRRACVPDELRLMEIGLRPGQRVRIVQRVGLGGKLLALGCARIAIDAETARRIEVEVLT
jgi:Fe2+ transport system protein FeoA